MPVQAVHAKCLVHRQVVRLGLADIKLILSSQSAVAGAYEFVCPLGGHDPIRRLAGEEVVQALRSNGITPNISDTDPLGPFLIRTNDEEEV